MQEDKKDNRRKKEFGSAQRQFLRWGWSNLGELSQHVNLLDALGLSVLRSKEVGSARMNSTREGAECAKMLKKMNKKFRKRESKRRKDDKWTLRSTWNNKPSLEQTFDTTYRVASCCCHTVDLFVEVRACTKGKYIPQSQNALGTLEEEETTHIKWNAQTLKNTPNKSHTSVGTSPVEFKIQCTLHTEQMQARYGSGEYGNWQHSGICGIPQLSDGIDEEWAKIVDGTIDSLLL
jgi:hypothetical protein